ncbi:MAG: hypothetical protein M0Q91_15295 [Methanoregula sp.]|jgi:hypothetical protein|nr:hypothetical protein [Methanoregula sp.]
MVRSQLPKVKVVSRFDQFLCRGLSHITGEDVSMYTISDNRSLISCISNKLARDTGLDSSDIAQWISRTLKQYWAETELSIG